MIQRITFEDRGQDFLWWEIDMETGRVVGCGPFQAGIWAAGNVSVDPASISVGGRLRYFAPPLPKTGGVLRYAVTAIDEAESGGGVSLPDPVTLQALCDEFNLRFPAGTRILIRTVAGQPETVVRTVSSYGASILGGHSPVVYVVGAGGCWHLDHVIGRAA
ncbi:hypothetical protein SAMN02983003_3147 [Devosia enhydra]|uniref:Uncharacterized protein n=1 Tax=Devosia enhydra TaxID=665118 RepID=A0A1K2I123_9HYPH|nr:hypothetical protein [Devosia enhydra]SFZ85975.1 hypothetical protein SAMN02983003_3147 [Devosia enhydra]